MIRNCDSCGNGYAAKSSRSRFCSDTCRVRHARGAAQAPAVSDSDPLVKATKAELETAGKLDTRHGQQALILAARMSGTETPAGIGCTVERTIPWLAAAIGATPPMNPAPGTGDAVDELKARRDSKRKA